MSTLKISLAVCAIIAVATLVVVKPWSASSESAGVKASHDPNGHSGTLAPLPSSAPDRAQSTNSLSVSTAAPSTAVREPTMPLAPPSDDVYESVVFQGPLAEARKRFVGERKDGNWSANVEAQLAQSLSLGSVPQSLDIVAIECRSTLCELRGVANSVENNQASIDDWQKVVYELTQQNWWKAYGLDDVEIGMTATPDGRIGYGAYLVRGGQR